MNSPNTRFYGWHIVGSCFVIALIIHGPAGSVWQLLGYLGSTADDLQKSSFSWAIGAIPLFFVGPFVGWLVDRVGCKKPMLVGCLLSGAGVILFAGVSQVWHYALVSFIVTAGSLAATGIPMYALLLRWFNRNRGLAISIVSVGTGIGYATAGLTASFHSRIYDMRASVTPSVIIVGVATLIITIPLILRFIKDRPSEMGLCPDGIKPDEEETVEFSGNTFQEAYHMPSFWYIAGALCLVNMLWATPLWSQSGSVQGAHTLMRTGQALSRYAFISIPFIGILADRRGAGWTFAFITRSSAVCVGFFAMTPISWSIVSLPLLQRICAGGVGVLTAIIIAERYGLLRFGIIYAVLGLIGGLGSMAYSSLMVGLKSLAFDSGFFESMMGFRIVLASQIVLLLLSAFWMNKTVRGKE